MSNTQATAASASEVATQPGPLTSSHGKTTIADTVVSKVAGLAAREVNGVHALGGSASRAVGALRARADQQPARGAVARVPRLRDDRGPVRQRVGRPP